MVFLTDLESVCGPAEECIFVFPRQGDTSSPKRVPFTEPEVLAHAIVFLNEVGKHGPNLAHEPLVTVEGPEGTAKLAPVQAVVIAAQVEPEITGSGVYFVVADDIADRLDRRFSIRKPFFPSPDLHADLSGCVLSRDRDFSPLIFYRYLSLPDSPGFYLAIASERLGNVFLIGKHDDPLSRRELKKVVSRDGNPSYSNRELNDFVLVFHLIDFIFSLEERPLNFNVFRVIEDEEGPKATYWVCLPENRNRWLSHLMKEDFRSSPGEVIHRLLAPRLTSRR